MVRNKLRSQHHVAILLTVQRQDVTTELKLVVTELKLVTIELKLVATYNDGKKRKIGRDFNLLVTTTFWVVTNLCRSRPELSKSQ